MQSYETTSFITAAAAVRSARCEDYDLEAIAELDRLFNLPTELDYNSNSSTAAVLGKRQTEEDLFLLDDLLRGQTGFETGYEAYDSLFGSASISGFGEFEPVAVSSQPSYKEALRIPSPSVSTISSTTCSANAPVTRPNLASSSTDAVTAPAAKAQLPLDPASRKRERNRLAAERCRQRKTGMIETLQRECEELRAQREQLLEENQKLLRALGLRL